MKSRFLVSIIVGLIIAFNSSVISAQNNGSVADKKFEVAAEFTTITFDVGETKLLTGGRLTYNLNSHVALEGVIYQSVGGCDGCGRHGGHMTEGLFGVKIGKRFNKWGIFGKVRPGFISSTTGGFEIQNIGIVRTDPPSFSLPSLAFKQKSLTTFAADVGGVVEYYPTKRLILRADFGSTIIHYGKLTNNFPVFDPATGGFTFQTFTTPAQNRGTLQFSTGVGFRF